MTQMTWMYSSFEFFKLNLLCRLLVAESKLTPRARASGCQWPSLAAGSYAS